MTSSVDGTCRVDVNAPAAWFTASSAQLLNVTCTLPGTGTLTAGTVTVQPYCEATVTGAQAAGDVIARLPEQTLLSGNQGDVVLTALVPRAVDSFTLQVRVPAGLTIIGATTDATWTGTSTSAVDGTSITGTYFRSAEVADINAPVATEQSLLRVTIAAQTASAATQLRVNATIVYLSDVTGKTIVAQPAPALVIGRGGATARGSGMVFVAPDTVAAVIAIPTRSELVNTAVLSGTRVTVGMTPIRLFVSGNSVSGIDASITFTSTSPSTLQVASDCSSVFVDGTGQRGTTRLSITVTAGSIVGKALFRVWFPRTPISVTVDRTVL